MTDKEWIYAFIGCVGLAALMCVLTHSDAGIIFGPVGFFIGLWIGYEK